MNIDIAHYTYQAFTTTPMRTIDRNESRMLETASPSGAPLPPPSLDLCRAYVDGSSRKLAGCEELLQIVGMAFFKLPIGIRGELFPSRSEDMVNSAFLLNDETDPKLLMDIRRSRQLRTEAREFLRRGDAAGADE